MVDGVPMMNQIWPKLELTREEQRYVRAYDGLYPEQDPNDPSKTIWKKYPGVMRRTYTNQLIATNFVNETNVLQDVFAASGRRTRVFAFTFSGYIANWQIKMFSTSGELWVQDFTTVTALCNGAPRRGAGMQNEILTGESQFTLLQQGVIPYRRDPNILLEGTQELVFQGQILSALGETNSRYVLNIGVHVWEFPDMPRNGRESRFDTAGSENESMGAAMARKG